MAESPSMVAPGNLLRRRLGGLLLVAPTVLAGLVALVLGWREQADRPTDADIAAAAATVRAAIAADTAIVIAPPWSLRPLIPLGALASKALPADGPWDALVAGRFARVIVIAEPDADPWLVDRPLVSTAKTIARHGPVTVLQIDGVGARFDARAAIDDATIRLHRPGNDVLVCAQRSRGSNGGVRCAGSPSSLRVAREWALVTENGADVVFAHPPPAGQRLEVAFDAGVEFGSELVVAAGHTRSGADKADPIKGVVRVAVVVDDETIATLERRPSFLRERHRRGTVATFVNDTANSGRTVDVADDDRGFRVERIDTARFAGSKHRLSFVIATDDDANNSFAFDAFVPGGP